MVIVPKKNGGVRICIDFSDLNKACPKDSFPLPNIDQLVEATSGYGLLSFMDGYSGYSHIPLAEEDQEHTAFFTPRGLYCYTKMPFGLKNAGATYQRMVEKMFDAWIHKTLEVYVDDMLVKSELPQDHVDDLKEIFVQMRKFNMKINPAKCTFGVTSGKFLGYLVTKRGIEVDPEKKLRTYFHAHTVTVITKAPIESVLDHADSAGRISKWGSQIKQFGVKYQAQTAIKTQVVADFLADFPIDDADEVEGIPGMEDELADPPELLRSEDPNRWGVFVDGSCNSEGSGIGILFTTPTGRRIFYSLRLEFPATNNIIEYEAVIHALRVIIALDIQNVRLTSDSQLVIRQIDGTYQVSDPCLQRYHKLAKHYIEQIPNITFLHLNRINNRYVDALAFIASMEVNPEATNVRIERVLLPSIPLEGNMDILVVDSVAQEETLPENDWRIPIIKCLANGHLPSDQLVAQKIISRSGNYQLRYGVLYK
ncbi:uncharacterized protein LOC113291786 [Papaver somniferum]|uniref:uncharacterized protein LOC113291786 n=1 Tax=Papaver somniferum TaxID=3469 RepID=UPI000E702B19|nr:uncharacterized protein LOC113291786 [Papaver somniferum]